MSPESIALLESYGMDYQRTLSRFVGNENLLLSFLKDLPEDESMPAVMDAKARGDADALKSSVHALKGFSGNLGLIPLYNVTVDMMKALRAEDTAESERLYPLLLQEYERAVEVSRQLKE